MAFLSLTAIDTNVVRRVVTEVRTRSPRALQYQSRVLFSRRRSLLLSGVGCAKQLAETCECCDHEVLKRQAYCHHKRLVASPLRPLIALQEQSRACACFGAQPARAYEPDRTRTGAEQASRAAAARTPPLGHSTRLVAEISVSSCSAPSRLVFWTNTSRSISAASGVLALPIERDCHVARRDERVSGLDRGYVAASRACLGRVPQFLRTPPHRAAHRRGGPLWRACACRRPRPCGPTRRASSTGAPPPPRTLSDARERGSQVSRRRSALCGARPPGTECGRPGCPAAAVRPMLAPPRHCTQPRGMHSLRYMLAAKSAFPAIHLTPSEQPCGFGRAV